jgi:ribonuclease HI
MEHPKAIREQARYGAVLRNFSGEILGLDARFIWDTTNNVAELTGLLQGLQSAMDKGHHKIILEGDSQVIIRLTTKILHGCHPDKVSPRWRLHGLLEDFNHLLQPQLNITTSHVRREANKVADCLANVAVEREMEHFCWEAHIPPDP